MSAYLNRLWADATKAAALLSGRPHARIVVGVGLPLDEVRELARVAGVEVRRTLYIGGREAPSVIESGAATAHGVEVTWQGSRPATPEDVNLAAFCSDKRREATGDEVLEALATEVSQ